MFNDITVGPITVHMYGIMIAIGYMMALAMSCYRGKKREMDDDVIWGIYLCAIIGGAIGTRLLYYIVEIPHIIEDPSILWDFKNGYVVYGGIIGGILASYVYCHKEKVVFLEYFDLVMPAVSLAQGIGRIGCLFAGCCYGRETDAWYGIVFQNSGYAPNGVRLIPTQIISSVGDFFICAVLLWYASKKPQTGRVASMYLILYGVGRFAVEFLRNDYRGSFGPFSTSQLISVGIVAIGVAMYVLMPKVSEKKTVKAEEKE
ncbi:MAG: prolipoprotein diacylglyceryl transferase [Roseburia sp.]|nr:prolipoprotein diacylglyceryl transferase [Roseburia sp.]